MIAAELVELRRLAGGAEVEVATIVDAYERGCRAAPRVRKTVDVWVWCSSDGCPAAFGTSADDARERAIEEAIRVGLEDECDDTPALARDAVRVSREGYGVRLTVPRGAYGVQILSGLLRWNDPLQLARVVRGAR